MLIFQNFSRLRSGGYANPAILHEKKNRQGISGESVPLWVLEKITLLEITPAMLLEGPTARKARVTKPNIRREGLKLFRQDMKA